MNDMPARNTNLHSANTLPGSGRTGYFSVYAIIVFTVLFINVLTDAERFADFDNYILYLNGLVHFRPSNWLYFEPLSNIFLLGTHQITRSVFSAMVLAHYVLGLIFVFGILIALPPRRASWHALLFAFAMLGPLLAFVTIRATPAYFLVALSVRFASGRRPIAWICLIAASLFHISALLAVIPVALLYFERNMPAMMRSDRSRRYYMFVMLAIVAIGAVIPAMSESIASLLQSIPLLSKYDIYTESSETGTQIGHYIFLAFVSAITFLFITFNEKSKRELNIYTLVSFAIYIILFFGTSPVAAFRQAPLWMLPMIATISWDRIGVKPATAPIFVLGCAGLFGFQFMLVYI